LNTMKNFLHQSLWENPLVARLACKIRCTPSHQPSLPPVSNTPHFLQQVNKPTAPPTPPSTSTLYPTPSSNSSLCTLHSPSLQHINQVPSHSISPSLQLINLDPVPYTPINPSLQQINPDPYTPAEQP
jgi:hypothetical protein